MYSMASQRFGRRRIGGCISSLVVLILLIGGLSFVLLRAHNGVTVSVGSHPSIVCTECDGNIVVRAGSANQVTFSGIFPQYQQDSTGNIIQLDQNDDLTMTVPPEANLQIGTAETITVLGVSGTMNLDVNGGRITLIDSTLEGQSKLDNNGGITIFQGNLAQGSASEISGNGGSIDVTLQPATAFHLDVTGIFGPMSSDYPEVQSPGEPGSDLKVDIGHPVAGTTLTLDVNDTAVTLAKSS
jgi:hypothetical protein